MDRAARKQRLAEAVISIGAKEGIHAITSRRLSAEAEFNQYYIYKTYDSIDEAMLSAYHMVSREFVAIMSESLEVFREEHLTVEESRRKFFNSLWERMQLDTNHFIYYIRYYYYAVFPKDYSDEKNRKDFEPLLEILHEFFKEDADVTMILLHLLEDILKYIALVSEGTYKSKEEVREKIYLLLLNSMGVYWKLLKRANGREGKV